jgi:hypothetical protein
MPSFPMTDGAEAEYIEGNFHVFYKGVTYLNHNNEKLEPFVFTDDSKGELNEKGEIEVNGGFKEKYVLPPAKTISIKLNDGSVAKYLEGALELNHNGDKYLQIGIQPLFSKSFPNLEGEGTINETKLKVPYLVGRRGICVSKFEKEGDKSLKKRKRLDLESEQRYKLSKKRAQVMDKTAPQVIELAMKAHNSIKELIALETQARIEAGREKKMIFEHEDYPLETAMAALSRTIRIAQGAESESEDDDTE